MSDKFEPISEDQKKKIRELSASIMEEVGAVIDQVVSGKGDDCVDVGWVEIATLTKMLSEAAANKIFSKLPDQLKNHDIYHGGDMNELTARSMLVGDWIRPCAEDLYSDIRTLLSEALQIMIYNASADAGDSDEDSVQH